MTDATTEFFDKLARRRHEPLLKKVTGTMRFDLAAGHANSTTTSSPSNTGPLLCRTRTSRRIASFAPTGACSTASPAARRT